jgi:tripartite-type tricarboxylate transporter receptor subunit TctC
MCARRTNSYGVRISCAALALFGFSQLVAAQEQAAADYPNRTIRIVVGFTPGGAPDITGRVIAHNLNEMWKQPVVVENRPGAGSTIAARYVATSPPDGYTLLSITNAHAVAPAITARLPYDTLKDFAPITMTSSAPKWILVPPSLGVRTLAELIALARQNPNQLNYPSSGIGSFMHFGAALFNDVAGIQAQHIPFKGPPEALTETIAGRVQYVVSPIGAAISFVREGKLLALAVTGKERLREFPNVPTVAESGFPGFEQTTWTGLLAPAHTPPAIIAKLNHTVAAMLKQDSVREKWAALGVDPVSTTPAELEKQIADDVATYTAAASKANIAIQ